MFRKEFLDTLRQTLLVLVFLAAIPLVYAVDRVLYDVAKLTWYLVNGFGLLTVILGFFLSLSYFRREHRENAEEYLNSLPIPKWKLFWCKFLPRLIVMCLFVVTNQLLIGWNWIGRDSLDLHPLNKGLVINLIGVATLLFFGYIVCVLGRKAWRSTTMLVVILAGIWSAALTRIPAHSWARITTIRSSWIYPVWVEQTSKSAYYHYRSLRNSFQTPQWERSMWSSWGGLSRQQRSLATFVNQNIEYLEWLLLMALLALAFLPVLRRIDLVPSRMDEDRFLRLAWIPFLLVALTIIGRSTGLAEHVRAITAEWLLPV